MKMNIIVILVVSFCIGITTLSNAQNKLESWYTYWGVGYANISYPKELGYVRNLLKGMPGVIHLSLCLDLFGFYWPKGENKILGVIVNAWGDRYEIDNENMQVNGILYSFSIMHYLNHKIGQGLFFRGDLGASRLVVNSSGFGDSTSDWGYGGLIGGGFGLPITAGTRILLNIDYSFIQVEGDSYGSLQISIGGLF